MLWPDEDGEPATESPAPAGDYGAQDVIILVLLLVVLVSILAIFTMGCGDLPTTPTPRAKVQPTPEVQP